MQTELDLGGRYAVVTEVTSPHIWRQTLIKWWLNWIIHTSLVTDKKISNIQEILPVLEQIVQTGAKLY